MALRLLGGDTGDGGSPRLYRDGDDYLVQGYTVTEPRLLAALRLPAGESAVRVPGSLWKYLPPGTRMNWPSAGTSGHMADDCGHHECHLAIPHWHAAEEEEQMAVSPTRTPGLAWDRTASPWPGAMRAGTRRRRASGLTLPAGGLRTIDEFRAIVGQFTGGRSNSAESAALARDCVSAFAALQAISAQHARYGPDCS